MTNANFDVNELPTLDFEVGAQGALREQPVVIGQLVLGIGIGIIIAVND